MKIDGGRGSGVRRMSAAPMPFLRKASRWGPVSIKIKS
jgi:hypothetical protein